MNYDIIGDIYGHADHLHALLKLMGYRQVNGCFRHPDRMAIFVGDYIDRGPKQIESVMTVRRMVDSGSALAIMGNHEFNAIAWATPDPDMDGEFLRPHQGELGRRNAGQHGAFLSEVQGCPGLHDELIEWFLDLPLWLDLPELRVVHACWHQDFMDTLQGSLFHGNKLSRELMVLASRPGRDEYRSVEGLTKGLDILLPQGHSFRDKDQHIRHHVRTRWWDRQARTYRDMALLDDAARQALPDTVARDAVHAEFDPGKPVFFGHYWMTGQPRIQASNVACLDYSVAKGGDLAAYQWGGEPVLDSSHFVTVQGVN